MPDPPPHPITFYFDFASPYGYFASSRIDQLAAAHGRTVLWRPMLTWAILKAQRIPAPDPATSKWGYFMQDMIRSAAFYGVPYVHPAALPISAHRAARLFYAVDAVDTGRARRLGHDLLQGFFAEGRDITQPAVLCDIASGHGLSGDAALEAMDGAPGRDRLAAAVDEAVASHVCGSPYFILDGEGFFGADRLPQLEWRLAGAASPACGARGCP